MQYKMNFNDDSPLRKRFMSGQFFYLVEYELPAQSEKISKVYEDLNTICECILQEESVAALTLTDRSDSSKCVEPLDLISKITARSGVSPIVHLSGKGYDPESMADRLAVFASDGANNVLAMSGDLGSEYQEYTDSVDIIKKAHTFSGLYVGAVVNPFKYTVNDSYGQYFKMLCKINAGAEYIVSQVGWDMKKLQELLLFCRMRDVNVPLIARLSLLSEEDGKRMTTLSLHKGVPISREFASQVQRELLSSTQFMTTQLRRLCLQIIGCEFMGYSGVQLCGLHTAEELRTVLKTVAKMKVELRTFKEWVEEWQQFHHGVSMATTPYNFYIFKNLLKYQTVFDIDDNFELTNASFDQSTFPQKWKYKLAASVNLEKRTGLPGKLLRSLLTGSGEEPEHDLRQSQYLSMKQCPKKLTYGPCGGGLVNGDCENGQSPCIHNLRLTIAADRNELDKLEDPDG